MPRTISVRGELSLDGSGWQRTLSAAGKQTEQFGTEILGGLKGQIAAAFSVGAVIAFSKELISSAAHIKDLSEQTGLTTDRVQELTAAAKLVGLEFEDVSRALEKMGKMRKDAALGDPEAQRTLQAYGIAMEDLRDPMQSNFDLLKKMGDATKNLTEEQRQQMREIFGKGGGKMGAVSQALNSGIPISTVPQSDIDRLDRFSKINERMWDEIKTRATKGLSATIDAAFFAKTKEEIADAKGRVLHELGLSWERVRDFRGGIGYSSAGEFGNLKRPDLYGPGPGAPSAPSNAPPMYGYQMYQKPIGPENYKEPDLPKLKANADSLVRVGNFLGDAPKMARIAETQLQVSRDMLQEQKTTNWLLKASSNGGDGFLNQ